jgi:hypothetical protein
VDQSPAGTSFGAITGTIDGANTSFTVSNGAYVTGTLIVILNGQEQTQGASADWVEATPASGTFTMNTAPPSGAVLGASYVTQTSTSGNLAQAFSVKTTTYSMTASTDYGIYANATSGAFSVTPPATTTAGYEVIIKKTDASANAVTVVGTVDGATNYSLGAQYKYVRLVTTTTSGTFYIIGNN